MTTTRVDGVLEAGDSEALKPVSDPVLEERLMRLEKAIFALVYLMQERPKDEESEFVDELACELLDKFMDYCQDRDKYRLGGTNASGATG